MTIVVFRCQDKGTAPWTIWSRAKPAHHGVIQTMNVPFAVTGQSLIPLQDLRSEIRCVVVPKVVAWQIYNLKCAKYIDTNRARPKQATATERLSLTYNSPLALLGFGSLPDAHKALFCYQNHESPFCIFASSLLNCLHSLTPQCLASIPSMNPHRHQ